MGLSIAHQLARRGHSVQVISRRRSEAAGFVAAGMRAPHAEGRSGNLLALGQRSLELVPSWLQQVEADSDLDCGHRPCGIVVPFRTARERDAFPNAGCGVALNRDALEREIPGIAPGWSTGLLFEQDGQIDNRRRLMRALERACSRLGVQFEEGAEVQSLQADGQGALQAISLRRADGELQQLPCQQAVLCSGAWSGQLCRSCRSFRSKGRCSRCRPRGKLCAGCCLARAPIWCPGKTDYWWWVPRVNQRPVSAKGSRLKDKNNWRPVSPRCCRKPANGHRWSAGGAFAPAHPMRVHCLGLAPWPGCGWPAATGGLAGRHHPELLAGAITQETPSSAMQLCWGLCLEPVQPGDQPSTPT